MPTTAQVRAESLAAITAENAERDRKAKEDERQKQEAKSAETQPA